MADKKSIEIRGSVTFQDIKQYNFYHYQKVHVLFFVISWLLFLLIFLVTNLDQLFGEWSFIPIAILAYICVGVNWLLLVRRVKKDFDNDQLLQNKLVYIMKQEGISQTNKGSSTWYLWSDFVSILEDKEIFRFYLSKNKTIIIPKSFFAKNEALQDFRKIVLKNNESKKVRIRQ